MLDDFRLFIEIARRRSVSQTAADTGLTVSTLSRRLKALEQLLGQPLVLRSSRGVQLTSFGQELYTRYGETVLDLRSALSGTSPQTQTEFHFHCPQNLVLGAMYPALVEFQTHYPDLRLHIEPVNKNQLLSQQRWDLALRVGEQRSASWYQKRIGSIRIGLVKARHCKQPTRLIMPYSAAQIGSDTARCLNDQYHDQMYVNDISLARRLTEDGFGIGLLPMVEIADLAKNVEFSYINWAFEDLARPIFAMWPNTLHPPELTSTFIDMLLNCAMSQCATNGNMIAPTMEN